MRLIDADRLKRQVEGRSWRAKGKFIEMIDKAPAVEPVSRDRVFLAEGGRIIPLNDPILPRPYEVPDSKTLLESFREAAKQRPHGQWELHEDDCWSGGGFTKCSACGYGFAWGAFFEAEEWGFCPICGASMDLKGEPHEQN